jgi:hypothetical protein
MVEEFRMLIFGTRTLQLSCERRDKSSFLPPRPEKKISGKKANETRIARRADSHN